MCRHLNDRSRYSKKFAKNQYSKLCCHLFRHISTMTQLNLYLKKINYIYSLKKVMCYKKAKTAKIGVKTKLTAGKNSILLPPRGIMTCLTMGSDHVMLPLHQGRLTHFTPMKCRMRSLQNDKISTNINNIQVIGVKPFNTLQSRSKTSKYITQVRQKQTFC